MEYKPNESFQWKPLPADGFIWENAEIHVSICWNFRISWRGDFQNSYPMPVLTRAVAHQIPSWCQAAVPWWDHPGTGWIQHVLSKILGWFLPKASLSMGIVLCFFVACLMAFTSHGYDFSLVCPTFSLAKECVLCWARQLNAFAIFAVTLYRASLWSLNAIDHMFPPKNLWNDIDWEMVYLFVVNLGVVYYYDTHQKCFARIIQM